MTEKIMDEVKKFGVTVLIWVVLVGIGVMFLGCNMQLSSTHLYFGLDKVYIEEVFQKVES